MWTPIDLTAIYETMGRTPQRVCGGAPFGLNSLEALDVANGSRNSRMARLRFALWLAVLLLVGRTTLAAGFELAGERDGVVRLNDAVLVSGDEITYTSGWKDAKADVRTLGSVKALNCVLSDSARSQYRREVAVSPARVEITAKFRLFPYQTSLGQGGFVYRFRIPYERVSGAAVSAMVGSVYEPKRQDLTLAADRPDGLVVALVRYMAFKRDGLRLVVDMQPHGLSAWVEYGSPSFIGRWSVYKKDGHLEFIAGGAASVCGGTFSTKALLYEGEYDYENAHVYSAWHYQGSYALDAQCSFGSTADRKGWIKADGLEYTKERGCGWRAAEGLSASRNAGGGLLHNAVLGTGGNAFQVDVTPGVYAVTIQAGGVDAGPFDIALVDDSDTAARHPGGVWKEAGLVDAPWPQGMKERREARAVTVSGDKPARVHLWAYVHARSLRILFNGKGAPWAVSSVSVQPLIYANEDFAIDRGPWLVSGLFEPEG